MSATGSEDGAVGRAPRPVRDAVAALLQLRGYTQDASDEYDMFWYGPQLGVRPMLVCLAYEMSCDVGHPVEYWDRYEVAIAHG